MWVKADKTNNYYRVDMNEYNSLLQKEKQRNTKKADENCVKDISKKHKKILASDTILKTADREAFVTLKDHKESFDQDPKCRLLNPTKPEMGRVAKQILHKN